jgi:hypothetical protein
LASIWGICCGHPWAEKSALTSCHLEAGFSLLCMSPESFPDVIHFVAVYRDGIILDYTSYSFMEQSPLWIAASRSAGQEIPHLLWKQKIPYHNNKSPSLATILSQLVQNTSSLPIYFSSILILSSHVLLYLPSGLLSFRFFD